MVSREVALSIGLLLLGACSPQPIGPPTVHLAGSVTIDNAPLPDDAEASIMFKPTARGQAKTTSAVITKGQYDAPHVPKGKILVFLNVQQPTGRMVSEAGGSPYAEVLPIVAAEYGQGIELEATADNLQQDFDLRAVAK